MVATRNEVSQYFDLFRKVPRDLTEPSTSGAVVSIATVIFAAYLFLSEFATYRAVQRESVMEIDQSTENVAKMQINLDITFPKLPCEVIGLDATDAMGSHEVDIYGTMFRDRLNKEGKFIERNDLKGTQMSSFAALTRHYMDSYDRGDGNKVKQMLADGEGCRVWGYVLVNRVPGNLHLDTHSYSSAFGSFFSDYSSMDVSHTINHLSFGNSSDVLAVRDHFPDTGIVQPLDGAVHETTTSKDIFDSSIFEYYIKVVPTKYMDLAGNSYDVYQFSANSNLVKSAQTPSLYIRYDLSAVCVVFRETREKFARFLVSVCAIVGGIFTVAGLVDSFVHRGVLHLAKKAQLGKLG